jgi:hypothetical protein
LTLGPPLPTMKNADRPLDVAAGLAGRVRHEL